ncbi:MAG TPA: glycerophosphodiester phosphodiesterase [Dissulfurispiraceae bacterium]
MFLKIGHRGAKAYEIENTLQSFQKAMELGANAIELDVRRTMDEKLAVIHDDNLKRVFGADVQVRRATLKELKLLTGDRLPSLAEALKFLDNKTEKILVELKETGYEGEVLDALKKEKVHDRVIVISFHEKALSEVRRLDDIIETGLIYSRHKTPVAAALRLNAQYLVPLYKVAYAKTIREAHQNHLKVVVWTINTKAEAEQYRDREVDGIASDTPDIFQALAERVAVS